MKMSHLEALTQEIIRRDPEAWKYFYPRRYACPDNYLDPKYWSLFCYANLVPNGVYQRTAAVAPEEEVVMARVVSQGMPTYFLGHDFTQALLATKLPEDCSIADLHLPLDEMVLILPLDVSLQYFGWATPYIAYSLADTPSGSKTLLVATATVLTKEQVPSAFNYFAKHPAGKPFDPESFNKYPFTDYTDHLKALPEAGAGPTHEDDVTIPAKVLGLLFRLWAVISTGTQLIEREQCLRPVRIKKGVVKKSELWSPNYIGRTYRAHRESLGGHHASPQMHWRMGHTRWQPFGPQRSQRKLIWIQPMLIGSQSKNTTTNT